LGLTAEKYEEKKIQLISLQQINLGAKVSKWNGI